MSQTFKEIITNIEQLRAHMGTPSELVLNKIINKLDQHCVNFISHAPFLLLGTSDSKGNADVSPKGDPAGFVKVLDENTLAIPDRLGNRMASSLENILENPKVGLLFMIPGIRETLRINGKAQIIADLEIRELLAHKGKLPQLAIIVEVDEAFMHCAKCILRSDIWAGADPAIQEKIPSLGTILKDHTKIDTPAEVLDKYIQEGEKNNLY